MATARFEAYPIPLTELELSIHFLHPGYPPPTKILISLPRVDRVAADAATAFGVHHRTALLACQIIAGNAFDTGRLALDQARVGFDKNYKNYITY
jgi:hypothetical protein